MANFLALLVTAIPAGLLLGFGMFIIIRTLERRNTVLSEIATWEIFLASYVILGLLQVLGIVAGGNLLTYVLYFLLAATVFCFLFFIKTGKDKVVIVESLVRIAMLFKPKPKP